MLYGGHKSWAACKVGMVVNLSEKLSMGFDTHSRPRTTTLDHRQPHQKQWLTKGATATRGSSLPSFVLFFHGTFEDSRPDCWPHFWPHRSLGRQKQPSSNTILLHQPSQVVGSPHPHPYRSIGNQYLLFITHTGIKTVLIVIFVKLYHLFWPICIRVKPLFFIVW